MHELTSTQFLKNKNKNSYAQSHVNVYLFKNVYTLYCQSIATPF